MRQPNLLHAQSNLQETTLKPELPCSRDENDGSPEAERRQGRESEGDTGEAKEKTKRQGQRRSLRCRNLRSRAVRTGASEIYFVGLRERKSRSYSVYTNNESLHLNESKPDANGFEGKARELAVVIKKRGIGGTGGGGGSITGGSGGGGSSMGGGSGGSGSSTSGGGGGGDSSTGGGGVSGQSWSNGGRHFGSSYVGGNGTRGPHRSSGSQNIRGAVCAAGWLGLSVLSGLILV
ncbi:Uncharacterized protein Rs2_35991 [Raphanus sativus]|nr:hypothetical protein Rs2_49433 [Raphanus sativus]KAJ4878937.1 Uncharacterized protein Rs2_35991 [Raphanus sativus]